MFLCLIALYLATFFACAVASSAREGYWAPVTIFGIAAFYYYLSVPLELYLRGEEIFTVSPATFGVSPTTRLTIAWSALLALLGFIAGHRASGLGRRIGMAVGPASGRLPASLRVLAASTVVLFLVLYRTTIFEKLAYSDANERRFLDPVFGYLTRLSVLVACLSAGQILQRRGLKKAPAALLLAMVIGWGLHTSDKNPLLKAALGVSAVWVGRRSRSLKHLYLYCGAAVLAIAALPVFSAYRANAPLNVQAALTEFSVQETDAKGPMMSLVVALEEQTERFWGRSYLFSLVAWIPRSVWPDRPEDLAHEFALDEMPDWSPGSGLGYSLLAEAYLNFGYAGAFLQYFGIAFCLGRLWVWLDDLIARRGDAAYWRTLLAVTYYEILILMHRVPSSGILQSCIFELAIPVAAFYMLDARGTAVRRGATPPVARQPALNSTLRAGTAAWH